MVVCGGLRWFSRFLTAHGHTDVLSSQILVVVCGGLRWCVVVCGGLWWFAVVCGGLWWIAVVCLLVIPATSTRCRDKFLPAVKFFPPPVTLPSVLSAVCIAQN